MTDYSPLFAAAEQKYGLPPGILPATAKVESSFNPHAVSPQGAVGLMQFIAPTAKALGIDPTDPAQAIDGAGRLWAQNLKAAGGDIDRAAMMYHGGNDTRQWGQKTHAYPGKLAAALPSTQTAPADPIEAALSGGASASPSQPAQEGGDPIEAALSGQDRDMEIASAQAQAAKMLQSGDEKGALALLAQHHLAVSPEELSAFHAGKRNASFHHLDDAPPAAPPQQTDQGLGFYQGLMKPLDNAATWLQEGAAKVGLDKPIDALGNALGLPSNQQAVAGHQAYIQGQEAQGKTPGGWGKLAGSILSTLPVVAATKNPWLAGGIGNALDSEHPNDANEVAKNFVTGAIGGKVTDVGVGALSSALAPQVGKAVQSLHEAGVPMTPGQIVGGAFRRIEDGATSIPLLGDIVKNAQRRSIVGLNTATINKALDPVGKELPTGLTGREAVDFAHNAVSSEYNKIVPTLRVQSDDTLKTGLRDALAEGRDLPADKQKQLQNIVQNNVLDRFNPDWSMSGTAYRTVDEKLGQLRADYSGSNDPDQRAMGRIIGNVQSEMREMLVRANPAQADKLGSINTAFANLVRIEGAAGSAGAKGGIFTPSQLGQAVKRYDTSARKNATARGRAMMQDVSDAAQQVLPQTVPDSGTPLRMMAAYLLGGGLGAGHVAAGAAATLPLSLYTKVGQKAFQKAVLSPRGPGAKALAKALTHLKAPLAVAGGQAIPEAASGF